MMRRVLSMGLVVCMFFAMAISACMPGDFTKDASVSESDRIGFVSEVLENTIEIKTLVKITICHPMFPRPRFYY